MSLSSRLSPLLIMTLTAAIGAACGDQQGGTVSDGASDSAHPDTTTDTLPDHETADVAPDETADVAETLIDTTDATAGPIADAWQAVDIASCDGLGPGTEDCHYRLLWRPAACGGTCSRLLVYWSGGEQGCVDGSYDTLLGKWADSGVLVACAQPFTTSDEAGRYPYADELERMQLLTDRIRAHAGAVSASPAVASGPAWDGRYLVIGGVSHGATAPVAAIARSRAFATRPGTWTGRDGTAVILFDGISDPARLEASLGLSDSPGCGPWHARFVGRYGPASPLIHACDNDACYCAGGGSRWDVDTTVVGQTAGPNWPASPYTCDDLASPTQRVQYRIVSCGGGQAEPCGLLGDIIPDDQQTRLADALATCPALAVTYADHPGCAHTLCGSWDFCGGEKARDWLTSLGW